MGEHLVDPQTVVHATEVATARQPDPMWASALLWALIDEHLSFDDCRPPQIGFLSPDEDDSVHEVQCRDSYDLIRPDLGGLLGQLDGPLSFIVRNLDAYGPHLAQLAADIETCTGQPCQIDAILCGSGSSFVDEPPRPLPRVFMVISGTATFDGGDAGCEQVSHGHLAIVPAGPAVTVSARETALAIRVPFAFPTRLQLRQLAIRRAHFHPLLRADLPTDLEDQVRSYGGSLYDESGLFASEAILALGADSMASSVALLRSDLRPRPSQSSLGVLEARGRPGVMLRCPLQGGLMVADSSDGPMLIAAQHQIVCNDLDIALELVPLLDGSSFSLDEVVESSANPDGLSAAVDALIWLDLLVVVA